jgi:hypothetical protein
MTELEKQTQILPQQTQGRGRRRGTGQGRQKKLSLRNPVTFAHKLEVINFFESHDKDINATIREFYSDLRQDFIASRKRQIYKWVKDRATIEEMCFKKSTANQTRKREKGTATTLSDEAENELVQWIIEQKEKNTISSSMLKEKAMEIAQKYKVPEGSFQATWTWQQGFFKRHQMTSL